MHKENCENHYLRRFLDPEPVMFLTISRPNERPIVVSTGTAILTTAPQNPPPLFFLAGAGFCRGVFLSADCRYF